MCKESVRKLIVSGLMLSVVTVFSSRSINILSCPHYAKQIIYIIFIVNHHNSRKEMLLSPQVNSDTARLNNLPTVP